MAQYPAKAMKAYEKAHAWRELFTLAKEQQLDEEAIAAMVERVTGKHIPTFLNGALTMQTICPVEEGISTPHRCSWITQTMWIVQCRSYPRVWNSRKHSVSYVCITYFGSF
jgi:hypothetical protein